MVAKENSLRIAKRSDINKKPLLNWHFMASIARRSGEVSNETYQEEKRRSSRILSRLDQVKRENSRLKQAINEWIVKDWFLKDKNPELWEEIQKEVLGDD